MAVRYGDRRGITDMSGGYSYSTKCEYCKKSPTDLIYTCEECAKGHRAINEIVRIERRPVTQFLPYAYIIAALVIASQVLFYFH